MLSAVLPMQSDKPVVIDFWASWCGPCKLIEPLVTKLQEDNPETLKVVKIECDANPDIVEKYEVRASNVACDGSRSSLAHWHVACRPG